MSKSSPCLLSSEDNEIDIFFEEEEEGMLKCGNPMVERLPKPKKTPRPRRQTKTEKVCFDSLGCGSGCCICITTSSPSGDDPNPIKVKEVELRQRKSKVTFVEDERLIEIFEFEDDPESKSNRKLFWEIMAADRLRFKDRIKRLETVLSPVLSESHRNVVFVHRMQKSSSSSSSSSSSCPNLSKAEQVELDVQVQVEEFEMVMISPES